MTDLAASIEGQFGLLVRRGPYALLALAVGLIAVTAPVIDARETVVPVALGAAALGGWHWFCVDRLWDRGVGGRLGAAYLVVRTAAVFALAIVNPFFVVFAFIGYLDASVYVGRRGALAVIAITAVTMAGGQSGGLPPRNTAQALGFAALFLLNLGLTLFLHRLSQKEERLAIERDSTIEALEMANARLAEALAENESLSARLVEQAREAGVHAERERLALDIHDTIAQSLTGIVTQLQAAGQAPGREVAGRHHERAAELAREALAEARRSVQGMLPHRLDDAQLPEALTRLAGDWSSASGVAAQVVIDGEAERLHRDIESTVLRVAQEALANVEKHARAARVRVTLTYSDDVVMLDVRDDGVGFRIEELSPPGAGGGFGLRGMRQRAARVVGGVVVESSPGAGTAVSLQVPAVAHGR